MTTASRESSLAQWFYSVMDPRGKREAGTGTLHPVSGDASFRRYFRAVLDGRTFILMDAPPNKEDSSPFVAVARRFHDAGVRVPRIHAVDLGQGFMCLEDFGDILLWSPLEAARLDAAVRPSADALYRRAFAELLKIQALSLDGGGLPPYDEALLAREMELFRDWLCTRQLGMNLDAADNAVLDRVFAQLTRAALAQPAVCVHRDYHSRNLMVLPDGGIGILDFQDAVAGPVTYDLVSLLRDCYIDWPAARVRAWALEYGRAANAAGILAALDEAAFLRDFDLMGVQRHLKAAGIFCRLHLRDGKPGYLGSIPRTLGYVRQVAEERDELAEFAHWFERRLTPALEKVLHPLLRTSA